MQRFTKFTFLTRPLKKSNLEVCSSLSASFSTQPKVTRKSAQEPEDASEKMYSSDKETHFGFETVSEEVKSQKVRAVFENVANRYDLMNDFMSVGIHRLWKDMFVDRIRPGQKTRLIDVAGGTGDIAFRFLKHQRAQPDTGPSSIISNFLPQNFPFKPQPPRRQQYRHGIPADAIGVNDNDTVSQRSVLVCDINPRMLEVGEKRALTALSPSEQSRIDWLEGDAENLSTIPDNSFDVYTIAFGIRNCVHIDRVLSEAYRVLKPGGRFMCLEFSHVNNSVIKWFYDQYSFQVIPVMGQVVAGDWDSYLYLVQSIRKFPTQEDFKAMIKDAGFRFVKYENLTLGVACIHSGFKLSDS